MRTDSMKADSMKADSTRTDNMKADSMTIDNKELNNVEATKEQAGQTPDTWQAYTKKTHVIGRTVSIITLVMLVGAPFLIGKLLGAYPDLGAVGKGFLSVGIVWLVSSIAEFLIYTPMLGAGGGYLAFITGNLINMKIPCAVNARDMVGAKTGTPENEIISTISIATSSLVTILVLALGVLLMVPLQPVLQSEVLQPAFENVVPALFGAMAYKYYRKNMKIAALPLILMSLLFILVPSLIGSTSFMIVPSGAIAIGVAYLLLETMCIAFLGTIVGAVLSIPLSFLAAANLVPRPIALVFRVFIMAIRTIPAFVYGLMFIRVTGPGPFAGLLTMSLCSIGMISKMFIESIEDLDTKILESLDAAGCTMFQKIRYGILSQLFPDFMSTLIYRFDMNLRDATVLGLVGAGGIGAPLIFAMSAYKWNQVGAILAGLIVLILIVEVISTKIRVKLTRG